GGQKAEDKRRPRKDSRRGQTALQCPAMKRFQLLVMLAAVTAAVIWYGFYRSRHTSSASVSVLLPKETLSFVHLPDFKQARADLHRPDLYQIWLEVPVQDFLHKRLGTIPT